MLRNNNEAVITRMAKQSLRSNRRRNTTILLAVMFSAFLLFSVFTVGVTFFKMQRIQNIRMYGADFDAYLYGVTGEQQRICRENPDIRRFGLIGVAGYVAETDYDSTPDAGLVWVDETSWNEMMEPAREWVDGEYPQGVHEIMVREEALKSCGLEGLKTGDTFVMTYGTANGEFTEEFRISGMWDGYGGSDTFYVSKAFYEQSGRELSSVGSGRCMIDLEKDLMSQSEQNALIELMNLGKRQNLFFNIEYQNAIQILCGILGLSLVICLCAYLLIYNIMYLSVSGNIRYYGLLQTVGMTGRQIRHLVRRQMTFLAAAGITGGILLGCGISFLLIPSVVTALGVYRGIPGGIQVTFHPGIVFLTVLLTGLTVFAAGRKPAKMAVAVSPVEALGYRPAAAGRRTHKTGKGGILWRLAREQLLKDKKKAGIVMLSLASGLSMFLCLVTILESQAARTILSDYMEQDMVICNDTLKKEDREDWTSILDETFLTELQEMDTLEEVHTVLCTEIMIPWEPEFSDIWMRKFYDMWMETPYEDDVTEYQEHPENFGSFLVGIDETEFSYLNAVLEEPIDEEAFLSGETCILYSNDLEFSNQELAGKKVTCAAYMKAEHTRTFEIAGLTDEKYYTVLIGYPPTVIVSQQALREFSENPLVYKVGIRYRQEYDEETENRLISMMEQSPYHKDFSYDSKKKAADEVKKEQGNMMEVGIGIALILAFIGILNYINTIVGNIQTREVEISVMESIGMTGKQVRKMLMIEGILFAAGSLCITGTLGVAVTYVLYQSLNYRQISFAVPVLPVLGAAALVVLVCVVIPLFSYRKLEKKGSIVERSR